MKSALNWVLLYVQDTMVSSDFYSRMLGREPLQKPKTPDEFVMYQLDGGWTLGLWNKKDVQPSATPPGGAELSFTEPDAKAVHARHGEWQAQGVKIVQKPTALDFGTTFTATDPDGHRIRVFAPPSRAA